jgi:hypothetical protein
VPDRNCKSNANFSQELFGRAKPVPESQAFTKKGGLRDFREKSLGKQAHIWQAAGVSGIKPCESVTPRGR